MNKNQEIKCNVKSCTFNDKANYCTKNDITVGNTIPGEARDRKETECDSFKAE